MNHQIIDTQQMPVSTSNSRAHGDASNPLDVNVISGGGGGGSTPVVTTTNFNIATEGWTAASSTYETTITGLNRAATRRSILITDGGTTANYFTITAWMWDSSDTKPSSNHTRVNSMASIGNVGLGYGARLGGENPNLSDPGDTMVIQYTTGATPNTTGTVTITIIESFG